MRVRGVTITETLVAIAIIAIVAALLIPVLVRAKAQAKVTDNLMHLRQLGQAAATFANDFGVFPNSTRPLVAARYVPVTTVASPLDETPNGLLNTALVDPLMSVSLRDPKLITPYKDSYIGLREICDDLATFEKLTRNHNIVGWLLDFTPSTRGKLGYPLTWKGQYRRLNEDASVVTRTIQGVTCGGKYPQPCRPTHIFFFDPDLEDLAWIREHL
jgi:competence protein ComGC